MARIVKQKELVNTRLATNYGGWMYCDSCNENIGYVCYSTYDRFEFDYTCTCGSSGSVKIDFEDSKIGNISNDALIMVKHRLCCPKDTAPLITILDKKLMTYHMNITCKSCGHIYQQVKSL